MDGFDLYQKYVGGFEEVYLLTPAVEGCLRFPPGLSQMASLHQGEIVWVCQGHLEPPIHSFLQTIQKAIG